MAENIESAANPRSNSRTGAAGAPPVAIEPWHPHANIWAIGVVVALAAFMEVLDTSIANVALPYMAGNLGASNDESTWVLTSYLVSNAIVLPISGWFASAHWPQAILHDLPDDLHREFPAVRNRAQPGAMILFRVLQGAGGGGLQPMAQAILADTFPPRLRGVAFALYGITTIVAPTIGPTLGGWITDNYSWRWIFFINLPVGIAGSVSGFSSDRRSALGKTEPRARASGSTISAWRCLTLGVGALANHARQGPGGRLVRVALYSYPGHCSRRSALISLAIWEWFSTSAHH